MPASRLSRGLFVLLMIFLIHVKSHALEDLTAPGIDNNPSLDVIVTSRKPLFSFFNSSGGEPPRTYTIQIDTSADFDSPGLIEYRGVPEENQYISGKRDLTGKYLEDGDSLEEGTRYHWRIRAEDSTGRLSVWSSSRFFYDPGADDAFMGMVRAGVSGIRVSSGYNARNIIDIDDPGQVTFWQSTPPGAHTQWVEFDLGKETEVARIWMLSATDGSDGWLKSFVWQFSPDGNDWTDISETRTEDNDTFRNIIDLDRHVKARYFRLLIKEWYGYAAQINSIILYTPGMPPVPEAPEGDYVLIVGNQQNGFTFTELARHVEGLGMGLGTLTVPHYEISLSMLEALDNPPVAVILSGNNADYPNLPMFEFNGEYELIREGGVPILGICCGHQQLAMAYGYTYARSMGWEDISAMDAPGMRTRVEIVRRDPVFRGIDDHFTAPEIHGWAVAVLPPGYELLGKSSYVQAVRSASGMIYGEQFHAEINVPYNEARPYLSNFLSLALEKRRGEHSGGN